MFPKPSCESVKLIQGLFGRFFRGFAIGVCEGHHVPFLHLEANGGKGAITEITGLETKHVMQTKDLLFGTTECVWIPVPSPVFGFVF